MEKQRIKSIAKSCRRLLVFLLVMNCFSSLFSQTLTASMIKALVIEPSGNQNMYAKEDLAFEVFIPYVKSNQVQVQSPSLPANVSFKQIKKTDYTGGGIKLEIWYSFAKKGDYQMPPLSLVIQNRRRTINFAPFSIFDNPADMLPRIVIEFSNGAIIYSDVPGESFQVPVGEKINFTVNLQYAVQLIQFDYDIPKDSIFRQTKLFEITEIKYREKKYSDELIPVASFEWTGLIKGAQILPSMKLQVTGYNGYRIDLMMPEFSVDFVPLEEMFLEEEKSSLFDDAFDFSLEQDDLAGKINITGDICEKLADYRIKERNSLVNYKANKEKRIAEEERLMLPVTEDEFVMGLFYLSILLLVIIFGVLLLLLRKKRKNASILTGTLFICAVVFYIYAQVNASKLYGIFKGGKISSIPEDNAESYSEIAAGQRVHVTEKAGKWYYIELGETGGWCESTAVILIR